MVSFKEGSFQELETHVEGQNARIADVVLGLACQPGFDPWPHIGFP